MAKNVRSSSGIKETYWGQGGVIRRMAWAKHGIKGPSTSS